MTRLLRLSLYIGMTAVLCAAGIARGECIVTERTCSEPGGTRIVNGIAVTRDCWAYTEKKSCLTDESAEADGCSTLSADASRPGPGKCRRLDYACAQRVTGSDGSETCLAYRERWACESKIALPALNAAWTGQTEARARTVDESACSEILSDGSCRLQSETCNESDTECIRTYACGGVTRSGCSVLAAQGCTRIKAPACSGEGCVPEGRYRCVDKEIPAGVVEAGDATHVSTVTQALNSLTEDLGACAALSAPEGTECEVVAERCVDSEPAVRTVNGRKMTSPCWAYERELSCRRTVRNSTCRSLQALASEGSCTLEREECTARSGEACDAKRFVYRCSGGREAADAGEAEFISSESAEVGRVEISHCAELDADESCRPSGQECLLHHPDGSCREKRVTYTCTTGTATERVSSCSDLERDGTCRLKGTECLDPEPGAECRMLSKTYECGGERRSVTTGTACDATLCVGGVCAEAPMESSSDFVRGIAVLEIARQATVYGDAPGASIFGGSPSSCSVKAAGFSCCRHDNAGSAALSNSAFSVALVAGVQLAGEAIKYAGSPLVYDILSASEATSGLLTALYGDAASGAYTPSFSFYGVTASLEGGSLAFSFSPMGFLASVAGQMAAEYFSCTPEDRMHSVRAANGLCHYVGSYCAKKGGGTCLEKRESWCCFNSHLARSVQVQGRRQLGLGWGTPESPQCRGFTISEFQNLDFGAIDLSEIISEVASSSAAAAGAASEGTKARAGEAVRAEAASVPDAGGFGGKCAGASCPASSSTTRSTP